METKKIFMLLDGSAIIHRAYHAMPPFTTSEGVPTGAVHGFFSMLLKLIAEIRPRYIAVAFDRGKPTFRQEMFVGYHANRPRVTSDLADQFRVVEELLEAAHIPVFGIEGFEADDLLGTMNEEVNRTLADTIVYIVTGDRDMLQLANHDTKVLMPIKGISEVKLFDPARVLAQYGVKPSQFIDYKALIGDPSDNYPGVAGVGSKTAAQLLSEYKTLEGIYKNIREIEKKNKNLAEKLAADAEQAALAKRLATIDRNAPFVFTCADCNIEKVSIEDLERGFQKYELRTLAARIHEVFGRDDQERKSQMKLL